MSIQCHVISRIVSLLLDKVISLMKHVQIYHDIVGTHTGPHVQCQCHVTSEIVYRLPGDVISMMKHITVLSVHISYACYVNIM